MSSPPSRSGLAKLVGDAVLSMMMPIVAGRWPVAACANSSAVGSVSAAFRATLTLRDGTRKVKVYDDFVFFGVGRIEYALNILAPFQVASQLVPFESSMAALLVKRAAKPCC